MDNELERKPELGQVWTPDSCAASMIKATLNNLPSQPPYQILDPAVGPATFQRAFCSVFPNNKFDVSFCGYDIDKRMCEFTHLFCTRNELAIDLHNEDFLLSENLENFDAVIMNPPYIRQECIPEESKGMYYNALERALGEKIDRRSNLFILFLLKALIVLRPGGILCAILYDAIMHSKYGMTAMHQIEKHADVLSNQEVKEPFGNAIIDARIICWRKRINTSNTVIRKINKQNLSSSRIALGSLLNTVRGTALPYRKIFIAKKDDPYYSMALPMIVKQRNPNLLTCEDYVLAYLNATQEEQKWLQERMVDNNHPVRQSYVKPITGFLCFNYYLRDKPRHLLNLNGYAVSDNFYVSNPNNRFPEKAAWVLLNSDLYLNPILACGRNQGHGLVKLQAYEYKSALVPDWNILESSKVSLLECAAESFLKDKPSYEDFRATATKLAMEVFNE